MQTLIRRSVSFIPWRLRSLIKRTPLIAPIQRWLLAHYLEGHEFLHTVDAGPARGLRYPITLPQDKGIWTGTYELLLASRMSETVSKNDICLDVGAWRGFFGGVMAMADAKHVTFFEPLPANCMQIRRVMELNPELPLTLIEAAVSDIEGTIDFCISVATSMGKLSTSTFQQDQNGTSKLTVRTVSLDGLLQQGIIAPPSIIKIDVEGAEVLVLSGARKILSVHRPKLFIELHSRALARECKALLLEFDYTLTVLETGKELDGESEPEVCHILARCVSGS